MYYIINCFGFFIAFSVIIIIIISKIEPIEDAELMERIVISHLPNCALRLICLTQLNFKLSPKPICRL